MFGNLSGWHLVVLIAIVLVLFGAPRLPGLARSVGESMRIFRREVKTLGEESKEDDTRDAAASADASIPGEGTRVDATGPAPARTE